MEALLSTQRGAATQRGEPATLRGEVFKSSETNTACKLRWFELSGPEGTLSWAEHESGIAKHTLSLRDALVAFEPDREPDKKPSKGDAQPLFGLRLTPAGSARHYLLRFSSDEERRIWAEAMEAASNLSIPAFRSGTGRIVRLTRPSDGRLGIDLGAQPGAACVTVIGLTGAVASAGSAGLLVGDVIVAVDATVIRSTAIAERAFARVPPRGLMTLRLAGWNREVRMIKRAGISGISLASPANGPGVLVQVCHLPRSRSHLPICMHLTSPASGPRVLVQYVAKDSAAERAGLNVGDRILAINSVLCTDEKQASEVVRKALQEVKLVVSHLPAELVACSLSPTSPTHGRSSSSCRAGPSPSRCEKIPMAAWG